MQGGFGLRLEQRSGRALARLVQLVSLSQHRHAAALSARPHPIFCPHAINMLTHLPGQGSKLPGALDCLGPGCRRMRLAGAHRALAGRQAERAGIVGFCVCVLGTALALGVQRCGVGRGGRAGVRCRG